MHLILFDDNTRLNLLPFTHTRPVADIRCGILTMRERWEKYLNLTSFTLTESYLQHKYPLATGADNLLVNAAVFASDELVAAIQQLQAGQCLVADELLLAARVAESDINQPLAAIHAAAAEIVFTGAVKKLGKLPDIFSMNDEALRSDFALLTKGRVSQPIDATNTVIGKENVFLEEGAVVSCSIINASLGPVYVAKDAEIMEGCIIRGPLAMGEHSVLKMGAKIYGATTIGAGSKVGGEVNNVVFFANSNKGHDGFLGNSVVGEWCNFGADSNNSNLKNNYDEVKLWSEQANRFAKTGLQFCGLMMADHSKCGINTMFNTGTVIGVSCNIFGSGFPRNFVPSFSWGGAAGFVQYDMDKALLTADRVLSRRGLKMEEADRIIFNHVFEATASQRNY